MVLAEEIVRILRLEPGMPLTGAWTEKEWEKLLRCVVSASVSAMERRRGWGMAREEGGVPLALAPLVLGWR
jgi:hypothetical protein